MNEQTRQHGISFVVVNKFFFVRLFAKMKMRTDGVFEKVNDQVSDQDEKAGSSAAQFDALRHHLRQ